MPRRRCLRDNDCEALDELTQELWQGGGILYSSSDERYNIIWTAVNVVDRVCSIGCSSGEVATIIRDPRPVLLDVPRTNVNYAILLGGGESIAFRQLVSVRSARN